MPKSSSAAAQYLQATSIYEDFRTTKGFCNFADFQRNFKQVKEKFEASKERERALALRVEQIQFEMQDRKEKLNLMNSLCIEDEHTIANLRKALSEALYISKLHEKKAESAQGIVKTLRSEVNEVKSQCLRRNKKGSGDGEASSSGQIRRPPGPDEAFSQAMTSSLVDIRSSSSYSR